MSIKNKASDVSVNVSGFTPDATVEVDPKQRGNSVVFMRKLVTEVSKDSKLLDAFNYKPESKIAELVSHVGKTWIVVCKRIVVFYGSRTNIKVFTTENGDINNMEAAMGGLTRLGSLAKVMSAIRDAIIKEEKPKAKAAKKAAPAKVEASKEVEQTKDQNVTLNLLNLDSELEIKLGTVFTQPYQHPNEFVSHNILSLIVKPNAWLQCVAAVIVQDPERFGDDVKPEDKKEFDAVVKALLGQREINKVDAPLVIMLEAQNVADSTPYAIQVLEEIRDRATEMLVGGVHIAKDSERMRMTRGNSVFIAYAMFALTNGTQAPKMVFNNVSFLMENRRVEVETFTE